MWGMHGARRLAIRELTKLKMSDADRVVYGKEYAVVDWVISGYRNLGRRRNGITSEDVSRLTLPTWRKVRQAQVSTSTAPVGGRGERANQVLEDIFSSKLDDIYQRSQAFGDEERSPKPSFMPSPPCQMSIRGSSSSDGSSNLTVLVYRRMCTCMTSKLYM